MQTNRNIVVTGCSSGIGYCAAKILAEHGYRVIATARKQQDIDRLCDEGLACVELELGDSASVQAAANTMIELCDGDIYALINNGAYGQPGAVEDLSRAALLEQFECNVFGTQGLTNLILPVMRAKNVGRIVNISSILGLLCLPYRGAYNASKYALEALSDTMRMELRGTDIQISLIEPGPIKSNFRPNALLAFRKHIDVEKSAHRDLYQSVEARLLDPTPARFTLPEDAVVKHILHALESRRAKIRYPVTIPTHILGRAKRWLPDRLMDRILSKSGGDGTR
ncbi:MAG: SDR family NAD(P)-dependent oxidoreductase [Gammaproteobacteria bacterium]|nr:SDR family NAD(P)-dependent oxidoreductase [Gammaproteobacteria bacterium]